MYYRGESQDYGETKCVPSIFRLSGYGIRFEQELYDRMQDDFHGIAVFDKVVNDSERYDYYYLKVIGVLQHYGCPTRLLDITRDESIARYFASCSNFDKSGYIYIFDDNETKEIRTPNAFCIQRKISCIRHAYQLCERNVLDELDIPVKTRYTITNNHIVDYHTVLKDVIGTSNENLRLNKQKGAFILFGMLLDPMNRLTGDYKKIVPNKTVEIRAEDKISNLQKLAFGKDSVCFATIYPDEKVTMEITARYHQIHIVYQSNRQFAESIMRDYIKTDDVMNCLVELICNNLPIWANKKYAFCFLFKEFKDYINSLDKTKKLPIKLEEIYKEIIDSINTLSEE